MEDAKILHILPRKLHRRVNRLVKIDDILIDERPSPELQNESEENVCQNFVCVYLNAEFSINVIHRIPIHLVKFASNLD